MRFFRLLPLLAATVALLVSGCTTHTWRSVTNLSRFKHIYVEHRLTDDRHIDEMIAEELKRLGYEASYGPLTMMPDKADAVLSYEDRWEWDFKSYLIELSVYVRTARTNKKLADGTYYQQTLASKSPAHVVTQVITPLFPKK
jgi:lysyl-tRNA synthetase class I